MSGTPKNIFALLDSDEEDSPPPAPAAASKAKAAPAKPANNADKKGSKSKPQGQIIDPSKPQGNPHRDGERRRGVPQNRKPRGEGERAPRETRESGGAPRQKREFDRRSGTGRDRSIKKEGGGRRNWGSQEGEAKEGTAEATASTTDETAEEVVEEETEKEPEVIEFTLDEFKAQQAAKLAERQGEHFQQREVRIVDASDLEGFTAVAKEEQEDFMTMGSQKTRRERGRKEKNVLGGDSVGFRAPPVERGNREDRPPRERREGGKGGRGGFPGRGRGGRGGRAPNLSNANDFPTLS